MTAPIAARDRFRTYGLLLAIVGLAVTVRVQVIGRDAFWLDEGYSWWDAQQPFAALWSLVPTCDPHPPLYFALLHGWRALVGDGTVALRSLSMLFGIATVGLVYVAGRQLDRARGDADPPFGIGLLAALLFALTPFQVYFSVEARPYALLCFGAALLTLACLRIVRRIESPAPRDPEASALPWLDRMGRRTWLLLIGGALLAVWTNNTAVLILGAVSIAFLVLWVVDPPSRTAAVPVLVAGALVAVLWAPDWPLLLAQAREVTDDFWIPPPSLAGVTFELHNLIGLDVLRSTWWVVLAVVGGLVLIGRHVGWRWGLMVAALALLPIALNVGISFAIKPILISRALIGAAPALALALAAAVLLLRSAPLRLTLAIVLVIAHLLSLGRFLQADHVKEPWKPVIARLAVAAANRAPVLVVPNELVLPIAHEARMQAADLRVIGLPADYPATDVKARYPSGKCAPSVIGQDLSPLMRSLAAEPVVVLLTRLNNTYDPGELTPQALRAAGFTLQREDVFQPGDLRVMRFVRAS